MDDGNAMVRNFVVAERDNNDHLHLIDKIGEKVSGDINTTANVNRPTGIKITAPGEAIIVSYYQRLIKYTNSFEIETIYPTAYQNPGDNEGIGYSIGFDVAADGTYAIASYARHICRVYEADGTLKFTIGIPASAGNVEDGKLWNAARVMFLPNGNLLVLSYNGRGNGCTNYGHISEYSRVDGSLVATRLGFYGDGQSAIGSNICYRPMGMDFDKKDSNLLWVSEYGRGRVLLINMTTWLIEDIYYAPSGYSFATCYGIASLSDGNFAVTSNTQKSIMVVDRVTKEVVQDLDVFKVRASADFRDVKELEPGYLIFTSWSSGGAFIFPLSNETEISYTQPPLPTDATLLSDIQFPAYDAVAGILTRRINDLDDVPEKIVVPYHKII